MANLADLAAHRRTELAVIEHVLSLLDDPRLRIDTTGGVRPVSGLRRRIERFDRTAELRASIPPDLKEFPRGEVLDVMFGRSRAFLLFSPVARLRAISVSPIRQLLRGEPLRPVHVAELNRLLEEHKTQGNIPATLILLSTSGFAQDTHDLAQRMASRTLVLVEPNDAGGFHVWGPSETQALNELIDPEPLERKRARIRQALDRHKPDLALGGVGVDRIATETCLPVSLVEEVFRATAKADQNLRAQRLDGRLVLYEAGATPRGSAGGAETPMVDRIRATLTSLPGREKKVAYLIERRDSIGSRRDAIEQEVTILEKKDAYLRQQFREATSEPARRRVAAQLCALRRRLASRQQMMQVLNRQLNVVSVHLGGLEALAPGEE
ncbi:MAG: hypothetical protein NZ561_06315, partial [Phycisphaerae bacterium]|nr:hypothetical protein [Phycisphaerae bacterium]MDW8263359.1 hypothetical protein [Phycisphaerales bacterium]